MCSSDLGGGLDQVRLAALIQLTLPGAPCIYYGDEIGLEGLQDPGCRGAYPAALPGGETGLLRDFMKEVIWLRRNHRALRDGTLRVVFAEGMRFAMLRTEGPEAFLVVANAGDEPGRIGIRLDDVHGDPILVELPGWEGATAAWTEPGLIEIGLERRSGTVVRLHAGPR